MTSRVLTDDRVPRNTDLYLKAVRDVLQQDQTAGPLRLPVVSNSMRPLLRAGDWVWIEAVTPETLCLGDLLVVRRGAELTTHRLVGQSEHGWQLHGDATRSLDPVVTAEEIVGRVTAIDRDVRRLDLQSRRWQTANRWMGRIDRAKLCLLRAARSMSNSSVRGVAPRWIAPLAAWPFQMLLQLLVAVELSWTRGES